MNFFAKNSKSYSLVLNGITYNYKRWNINTFSIERIAFLSLYKRYKKLNFKKKSNSFKVILDKQN